MIAQNKPGRLILQKNEKQDIYVDFHIPLLQHQLDGIRFLFRQFFKKIPGIILNDPSGYGKCVQTALFLNAVRPSLNKPIFILCDEYSIEGWKEAFQNFAGFDDIAIETANPFAKNMIYINTIKEAYSFCRRNWSIAVMHNNTFAKDKLQMPLKADFKIWITSVNMKENLQTFSKIYEWLHPSNKIKIDDYTTNKKNPRDVVEKAILLDAFLEDVVIRRNNFLTPFKSKTQVRQHVIESVKESPKKVSRKNKDPTGTKVKRSRKRIIDEDETPDFFTSRNEINNSSHDNSTNVDDFIVSNELDNKNNDKNDEMDVESFIRDEKPIGSGGFTYLSDLDYTSQNSNTFNEFQNAINEIIENENPARPEEPIKLPENVIKERNSSNSQGTDENKETVTGKTQNEDFIVSAKGENDITKREKAEPLEGSRIENELQGVIKNDDVTKLNINSIHDAEHTVKKIVLDTLDVNEIDTGDSSITQKTAVKNYVDNISSHKVDESSNEEDNGKKDLLNLYSSRNHGNEDTNKSKNVYKVSSRNIEESHNGGKGDVKKNSTNVSTSKIDDKEEIGSSKNNLKAQDDIDDKISEFEQKLLKKFKGSLLDNLF